MKGISKDELQSVIGLAIRKCRTDQNFTQEELAERAELHRTYLADIERGSRNPSLETVRRICLGLGVSIVELFQAAEKIWNRIF